MRKIKEIKSIDDLSVYDYNHLLERNVDFGVRNHTKAHSVETYNNILKKDKDNDFTLYGSFQNMNISDEEAMNLSHIQINQYAECIISEDGYITKNRYGADDTYLFAR